MRSSVGLNAAWNVAGIVVPSIAGILSVSLLLDGLGAARLGVFTLAVGLIGFSGVFDLGLGRALTQVVASEHGRGAEPSDLAAVVRRALWIMLTLGVFWAAVLWTATPMLVERVFAFEEQVGQEAVVGLRWVAVSLPAALVATGIVGCLEGFQRFAVVNSVRLTLGTASFMVPGVTAALTQRLDFAMVSLALIRILALFPWLFVARSHVVCDRVQTSPDGAVRRLMRFGAWLTVSSVVGPLMVFADRFYLASIFPPAVVALYTVPLDAVSRFAALPMGAVNAAFPELAKRSGAGTSTVELVRAAAATMTLLWFPLVAIGVLLVEELLSMWLNEYMASEGKDVARWLLLGVFLNGFAHIPYAVLQSTGRSDVTAKLHLLELPVYAAVLVFAVTRFGVLGAAIAWCSRIVLDTGLLFFVAARVEPASRAVLREAGGRVFAGMFLLGACMLDMPLEMRWMLAATLAILVAEVLRRFGRRMARATSEGGDHRYD